MVGQIDFERGDRHMAHGRGVKIGALSVVLGRARCANPVHGLAARAGLGNDRFCCMALAQAAHAGRLDLVEGQVGDIHIEQPGRAAHLPVMDQALHNIACFAGRRRQFVPVFVHL